MLDAYDSDLLDACSRYISMTKSVRVHCERPGSLWDARACWSVGGYTQATEICQAVTRVTRAPGRYRVTFKLRNGTDRFVTITRETVRATIQ